MPLTPPRHALRGGGREHRRRAFDHSDGYSAVTGAWWRMFDYDAAAELYFGHAGGRARKRIGYRRFAQASAAVQFAVEQLAPAAFNGAYLEVDDARFNAGEILLLYENANFPLVRKVAG